MLQVYSGSHLLYQLNRSQPCTNQQFPANKLKKILDENGISWESGQHSISKIERADFIVKSPGIPSDLPLISLLQSPIPALLSYYFISILMNPIKMCLIRQTATKVNN